MRLVESEAFTDQAANCRVSVPPSALDPPSDIRPGGGRGRRCQWVSRKDCEPVRHDRNGLFVSVSSLPRLSSIPFCSFYDPHRNTASSFPLNTVSLISLGFLLGFVLFFLNVSSKTVALSFQEGHTYFRDFLFSNYCLRKLQGFVEIIQEPSGCCSIMVRWCLVNRIVFLRSVKTVIWFRCLHTVSWQQCYWVAHVLIVRWKRAFGECKALSLQVGIN